MVNELYEGHCGWFDIEAPELGERGDVSRLDATARETIDSVLQHYGDYTSQQFSDLTHEEAAWKEARHDFKPGERGEQVISHTALAEYYASY